MRIIPHRTLTRLHLFKNEPMAVEIEKRNHMAQDLHLKGKMGNSTVITVPFKSWTPSVGLPIRSQNAWQNPSSLMDHHAEVVAGAISEDKSTSGEEEGFAFSSSHLRGALVLGMTEQVTRRPEFIKNKSGKRFLRWSMG
jgi:hypothetical protein